MHAETSRHTRVWRISCLACILAHIHIWLIVEATTSHSGRLSPLQGSIADPEELFYAPGRFLKATNVNRNAAVAHRRNGPKPKTNTASQQGKKSNGTASNTTEGRKILIFGTNHKTGTFFFQKAANIMKNYVSDVMVCSHWSGDVSTDNSCKNSFQKLSKETLNSGQKPINMRILHSARDPFDMAVSALLYHRKCDEKWVNVEISKTWKVGAKEIFDVFGSTEATNDSIRLIQSTFTSRTQEIFQSLRSEARLCTRESRAACLDGKISMPILPKVYPKESYKKMMNRLGEAEGLLVEMTRMIFEDLKNMMLAASEVHDSPGRYCTSCLNLFMDRTAEEYLKAWEEEYFPCMPESFISNKSRIDIGRKLQNKYKSQNRNGAAHSTDHSTDRSELIRLTEKIDLLAFGGLFKLAQSSLQQFHRCQNQCASSLCDTLSNSRVSELQQISELQNNSGRVGKDDHHADQMVSRNVSMPFKNTNARKISKALRSCYYVLYALVSFIIWILLVFIGCCCLIHFFYRLIPDPDDSST